VCEEIENGEFSVPAVASIEENTIREIEKSCHAFWCGCCATAQIARHEYAIPATGTVKYDCCSATGEP